MAEIPSRLAGPTLLSPDAHSLTSFPEPTVQNSDVEHASPPREIVSVNEPLYGLLDRSGPTMFDEQQTLDSAQPQTLSTASAEVLRGVIDHNGAVELVRRLSSMLAERDAHITALTRLCEEYNIPKSRVVDAASHAKQAERRRQSLATASEDLAPSNGSRSVSVVSLVRLAK